VFSAKESDSSHAEITVSSIIMVCLPYLAVSHNPRNRLNEEKCEGLLRVRGFKCIHEDAREAGGRVIIIYGSKVW
jgi:hypothetical protein